MKLLIDIGNTRIKWACQQDQRLTMSNAVVHRDRLNLSALMNQFWLNFQAPETILISNVAGEKLGNLITDWSIAKWGITPTFVAEKSNTFGITSNYCLESLGIDRWMALLALNNRFDLPAIVVDCGTAITADALTEQGIHLGGLIMPGLTIMRDALQQRTEALPAISDAHAGLIGHNTVQAISSGLINAVCGMIDRFILNIEQRGHYSPNIILTGGDARDVAGQLGRAALIEPDLVLMGLQVVADQTKHHPD